MVCLELRSRSRFRRDFGNGLQIDCAKSRAASAITRLLWGKDVRPPTYFCGAAVVSARARCDLSDRVRFALGAGRRTHRLGRNFACRRISSGRARATRRPRASRSCRRLCWFNSSDAFLHFLCGAGVVLSLLLIFGIAPALSLVGLLFFILSLTIAGQTFLSFQWDILLIETGFSRSFSRRGALACGARQTSRRFRGPRCFCSSFCFSS